MTYTVYGQPNCKYCVWAVNLLKTKGVDFNYLDIHEDPELKERFLNEWLHETVPQVYTKDAMGVREHIGGYAELVQHFDKITH